MFFPFAIPPAYAAGEVGARRGVDGLVRDPAGLVPPRALGSGSEVAGVAVVPTVLFVGDDASSTQIAETLLRRLVGDRVEIHTAGAQRPDPGGRADQMLVMMGLNPAHEERLSTRALSSSRRVVVLGTTQDVARLPGRWYEEWDITAGDLEARVEALAAELLGASDDAEHPVGRHAGLRVAHLPAAAAGRASRVLRALVGLARRARRRLGDLRRRR